MAQGAEEGEGDKRRAPASTVATTASEDTKKMGELSDRDDYEVTTAPPPPPPAARWRRFTACRDSLVPLLCLVLGLACGPQLHLAASSSSLRRILRTYLKRTVCLVWWERRVCEWRWLQGKRFAGVPFAGVDSIIGIKWQQQMVCICMYGI